jgi:radical SAM superfamily enzyme YgiQ (UPF0313 family)
MQRLKLHFIVDMDEKDAQFCPPLGIGYISAYLKEYADAVCVSLSYQSDDIWADIDSITPDIVAFSSTSRYFTKFKTFAVELKKRINVPIIWGGVHVTIAPHELPECADVGVLGEGEETVAELLANFDGGSFRNLDAVKGIVRRENGSIVVNGKRPFIEPLDRVPHPDLDLLRVKWDRSHRAVIMTSRGCPYKCRFCASSKFWDRTRLHSPAYVVAEIRYVATRYGVKEVLIYDDFFTIDRRRVEEIAELLTREPELRTLRYECLSRVDNFNEALAGKLKEMGVYRISFGIESGCQKTLDYLKNKKVRLEQVEAAIGIAKKYGFECVGTFVIGSPFETAEEIEQTLAFIEGLKLEAVQITIATPFPGTELWEDGKKIGKIPSDDWSDRYYVLLSSDESPALIAESSRYRLEDYLDSKVLMTQLDRHAFYPLARRSIELQIRTNRSIRLRLRAGVRDFLARIGLGFLLNHATNIE